ncbi:hypothetical protein [Streptomyces sp.]|uniref:hypothetical protein n=1 Tax=Streptomyces sp. TaxID=1931 RepID=UPI002F95206C
MSTEPGPAVDTHGNPVLDPTKNVLDLVDAAVKRLDDLRSMEAQHSREMAQMRAEYEDKLRLAETARIDAIRSVDQSAVQRAAEVQATQAGALATQVVATADAFRVSLAGALEPITKDIADLRKTQYEQAGQRTQVGESRLNVGTVLGGLSVLLVLVFGVIAVALR